MDLEVYRVRGDPCFKKLPSRQIFAWKKGLYSLHCYRASKKSGIGEKIMKYLLKGAVTLQSCMLLIAAGAVQAADEPAEFYVYGTYSVCDLAGQERADEIFMQVDKPVYDAAVADGTLSSYSYYAHHTGGKWRRGNFLVAPSIDALLDAQKTLSEQITAGNEDLNAEAAEICNEHEDYIWRSVAGKSGDSEPGKAVFSMYFVCDSRESQADAIVKHVFAPVYDKLVDDEKLTSWGYLEHIVGGHVRRIATMNATDMKSLMAARSEINQALSDNPLGDAFTNICSAHEDYMWEVVVSSTD